MKLVLTPDQIALGCCTRKFSPEQRAEIQEAIDRKEMLATAMTDTPTGVLLCIIPGVLVKQIRGTGGGYSLSFEPVMAPKNMMCFEVRDSQSGRLNMAVLESPEGQVSVTSKGWSASRHRLRGPGCDADITEPAAEALNRLLLRERGDAVVRQIFAYLVKLATPVE